MCVCSSDPEEAPLNVGLILHNSTAIEVTWAPVDREYVRGLLKGYKVMHPLESDV